MSEYSAAFGWHPIEEHRLILDGDRGANLVLTTDSVLCEPERIEQYAAIAFTARLELPEIGINDPALRLQIIGGMYGDLRAFRDELVAIRRGAGCDASMDLEDRFLLRLRIDETAIRERLCVEGSFNVPANVELPPTRANRQPSRRSNQPAVIIQFQFETPLVDPPHLDRFIADIGRLLDFLEPFDANDQSRQRGGEA